MYRLFSFIAVSVASLVPVCALGNKVLLCTLYPLGVPRFTSARSTRKGIKSATGFDEPFSAALPLTSIYDSKDVYDDDKLKKELSHNYNFLNLLSKLKRFHKAYLM